MQTLVFRSAGWLVAVLLGLGCGTPDVPNKITGKDKVVGLTPECLQGWWRDPLVRCTCPRDVECAYSDCLRMTTMGFRDGQFISLITTFSEEGNSISTLGAPDDRTYTIKDDTVTLVTSRGSTMEVEMGCQDDTLRWEYALKTRLDAATSQRLDELTAESLSWNGEPLRGE